MTHYYFIEPLDVLFLRGNKLFGDPGSYGESLMPPWPSAAAGAIRTMLLAKSHTDLQAFARGEVAHPELGTPKMPGSFRLLDFLLARLRNGKIETLHALPADLVISREEADTLYLRRMMPRSPENGIRCSSVTPQIPILPDPRRNKPLGGYWLTQEGFNRYLAGHTPTRGQLVESPELWQVDERFGVGLDASRGSAAEGRLFTVQAVAFRSGVGFLASVRGAILPEKEMLRLGGDGRAAVLRKVDDYKPPCVEIEALARAKRCRIVLATPGLFPGGWRLPGMNKSGTLDLPGVGGKVVCAAVPRPETVSGWDLARERPKPAQRAAAAGSVYWIEELAADAAALGSLMAHGLWPESGCDAARRVEGFNRFQFAIY